MGRPRREQGAYLPSAGYPDFTSICRVSGRFWISQTIFSRLDVQLDYQIWQILCTSKTILFRFYKFGFFNNNYTYLFFHMSTKAPINLSVLPL